MPISATGLTPEGVPDYDSYASPTKPGDLVKGEVISADLRKGKAGMLQGFLVEIGGKFTGYLSRQELKGRLPEPGQQLEAVVASINSKQGLALLSLEQLRERKAWQALEEAMRLEQPVEMGRLSQQGRSGMVGEVCGIKAFLPRSHAGTGKLESLKSPSLKVWVIECDRQEGNLVVSRLRAHQEEQARVRAHQQRERAKAERLKGLAKGQRIRGPVLQLREYGAFIGLGEGLQGLLHISEMAHGRVEDAASAFPLNSQVEVEVLEVDLKRQRVNLSVKALLPSPWVGVGLLKRGQWIGVTAKRLTKDGRLKVGLDDHAPLTCLIPAHRLESPLDSYKGGQELQVQVMYVSAEERHLALSQKAHKPRARRASKA